MMDHILDPLQIIVAEIKQYSLIQRQRHLYDTSQKKPVNHDD